MVTPALKSTSRWPACQKKQTRLQTFSTVLQEVRGTFRYLDCKSLCIQHNRPTELNNSIKSSPIPFPPVLISHSLSSLISQAYVSSFPAAALVLISPPPSVAAALSILRARPVSEVGEILKTDMKEFDFEPRFPIAVLVGKGDGSKEIMERECRLVKEGADLIEVEVDRKQQELPDVEGGLDLDDLEGKMRDWMDEIGV